MTETTSGKIKAVLSNRFVRDLYIIKCLPVAYPGIFFVGGSTNSVENRGQNGDLGCGSPLVRGSGGICNLVPSISYIKLS